MLLKNKNAFAGGGQKLMHAMRALLATKRGA